MRSLPLRPICQPTQLVRVERRPPDIAQQRKAQIEAALTGVEATGATGTLTASVVPIIVIYDTHDGDKGRKKRWEAEQERRERRKQELISVYEQLHEARPEIAERIVEPHLTVNIAQPTINWDALLSDIDRVERLMREHQEMDDEEVLLLL